MSAIHFEALRVEETADGRFLRSIVGRRSDELPAGDVLVRVHYSSLNYKDALSATGNKGVTRRYPHTPGIDAAGTVVESTHVDFPPGREVIVTGYDLGMNTDGGYGQYIRVPAAWVVALPPGLTLRRSMIYGTAGFTAAYSVWKLRQAGLSPEQGEVLVTGAGGGVGSVGSAILAKLGYTVTATSGKPETAALLKKLGVAAVVPREELQDSSGRPLLKGRWAGILDTVGGDVLSTALRAAKYGARASCCGLTAGSDLQMTVFPFILRGVSLLGVDSAEAPLEFKETIWKLLTDEWRIDEEALVQECTLQELSDTHIERILQGRVLGRVLVRML